MSKDGIKKDDAMSEDGMKKQQPQGSGYPISGPVQTSGLMTLRNRFETGAGT